LQSVIEILMPEAGEKKNIYIYILGQTRAQLFYICIILQINCIKSGLINPCKCNLKTVV